MRDKGRISGKNVFAIFVLFLAASGDADAWGMQGHRTIGAIADRLLAGSHAETQIRSLGLLKPGESLAKISVWADCAKGFCGVLTQEMKDFVRANPNHHAYHYTDLPFQTLAYEDGAFGTDRDDVVQTLQQCIAALQGHADGPLNPHRFSQRQGLLLLAHLVGDIHQPLHVGTAYIDRENRFAVPHSQQEIENGGVFKTHGDNDLLLGSRPLHAYWDGQAVTYVMKRARARSPAAFAAILIARYPDPGTTAGPVVHWPRAWATEILPIARRAHDGLTVEDPEEMEDRNGVRKVWPVTAPRDYSRTVSTLAARQLQLAGYRLAAVLKEIWP